MAALLEVALNGARSDAEHPAIPRTPTQIAAAARDAVAAGAMVIHTHVFDGDGRETFAADACDAVIAAIRQACPGVRISLTTSAEIEPDPKRRLELISGWRELPDLVTANQGEEGIVELSEHLIGRRIGIEAGLLELKDAEAFVGAGIADRCVRALIEPLDAEADDAVALAEAMEQVLEETGVRIEQVHHGDGIASWAVNERGLRRGHGIRTGLEDTIVLPDGRRAADNAELVRASIALMSRLASDY
ncbi:MAG TPA: 3-keto-5-aminohexanoate cleavage protein [Gaiellaceae bacterium]|nr:3-keto-5-aminohexanoate cleavage protein [Gaiellaceae bacterium]